MTFYRSYHGGTSNSQAATGDFRRHYGNNSSDFIKVFNPNPNFWEFAGDDEATQTENALLMLEEQILAEGSDTIASIMLEPIPGSAGVLTMPVGYMQGVRALCDKYGILLHLDEVRVARSERRGLRRCYGFQHRNYFPPLSRLASLVAGHGGLRQDRAHVGLPALPRRRP